MNSFLLVSLAGFFASNSLIYDDMMWFAKPVKTKVAVDAMSTSCHQFLYEFLLVSLCFSSLERIAGLEFGSWFEIRL